MQITVDREILQSAIDSVNAAVEDSAEDIHSHFLFRVREGKGDILASNGTRVFAGVLVNDGFECDTDSGMFSVKAWRIRQLLKSMKSEKVTFKVDGFNITVPDSRGEVTYSSLDPSSFPFWDQQFEDAKLVAKITASRLQAAFGYTKNFISDRENQTPALAAMEAREGALWATDQVAVSMVSVKGMEESGLSIHRNDVGKVMNFLQANASDEVEVREHDRCTLFVRADGGVLGVTRWQYAFPALKLQKDGPVKCSFTVDAEELKRQINFLTSAAKKNDPRITFKYKQGEDALILEVASAFAGKVGRTTLDITAQDGMGEFPEAGFILNHGYTSKIMTHFGEESLNMGINWTNKNGWVVFRHKQEEDDYLTVVVWLK